MTTDELEAWLREAAVVIHAEAPRLTVLDQAIGDGDHGTNMDRGFTAIVRVLDETRAREHDAEGPVEPLRPGPLLRLVGKTLISTVGGASGPLYGTAFLKAGASLAQADEIDAEAGVAALAAAIDGIAALGKAEPGDKTMLDALIPALDAARAAAARGEGRDGIARAMSNAAAAGAAATIPIVARKGRASYLGERSAGHQDPGATSASLLLASLADVLAGARAG